MWCEFVEYRMDIRDENPRKICRDIIRMSIVELAKYMVKEIYAFILLELLESLVGAFERYLTFLRGI